MQIEIMRHHGRSEDAEGEIQHFRVGDDVRRRRKTFDHRRPIRIGKRDLDREAHGDDAEQRHDQRLDPAEAEPLQIEDQEHVQRGDDHADFKRNAEDEIEADGRADHLGDVSRDDGDFGEEPQAQCDGFRKRIAAGLRQIAAGGDGKPRAKRLQHDRHDVGDQRDDKQRVAEFGAARERRRPVARVHIADGDEVAGADKRRCSPP
jgi:hypothetical protein